MQSHFDTLKRKVKMRIANILLRGLRVGVGLLRRLPVGETNRGRIKNCLYSCIPSRILRLRYTHYAVPIQRKRPSGAIEFRQASYKGPAFKICVVVHAYYLDTAEELFLKLQNIPNPFDLFVTTPKEKAEAVKELCRRCLPGVNVRIVGCENRGRNFGPFLVELRNEISGYDLMLHLHTKQSLRTGREQADWREHIVDHLVGSPSVVKGVLNAFANTPRLGVLAPVTYPSMGLWAHQWLSSAHLVPDVMTRIGISAYQRRGFLDFPVGGMLWVRPDALAPLLTCDWRYEDFPPEPAPDDGTLAHVIERCVGVVCSHQNYLYGEACLDQNIIRIGNTNKLTEEYFWQLLQRVNHIVKNEKVISFDFYDTLFTRYAALPQDVQNYIGSVLVLENKIPPDTNFIGLRKAAEAAARRLKGNGDVNLLEIYKAFPLVSKLSLEAIARAEALEKEIELRVLLPRTSVIDLCRDLAAKGKRLIIVSDTYMDEAFIRSVLKLHGIEHLFQAIYCSSDVGCRKDNGSMWAWLKRSEARNPGYFIHFGDNEQSDIQKCVEYGLQTFHVINTATLAQMRGCPMPDKWENEASDWRSGILLGPLIAKIGNDPFCKHAQEAASFSNSTEFGYSILGPMAFAFISWLIQSARRDGVDHLYFMSRDGYALHQLYDCIIRQFPGLEAPSASYLLVSRRSTLLGTFAQEADAKSLTQKEYQGTFADMLKARIGLNPAELEQGIANTQIILPRDQKKVIALIDNNRDVILPYCRQAAEGLRAYLEGQGVFEKSCPGVVDLGYSATIQKALQAVTGRAITGYYFATMSAAADVSRHKGVAHGYFVEEKSVQLTSDFVRNSILLEAFFAAPHGQVEGYQKVGDTTQAIHSDTPDSGPYFKELQDVATGMQSYCLDILKAYGPEALYLDYPSHEAEKPLRELTRGWGNIPPALRSALVVEDEFCGNGNLVSEFITRRGL